MLAGVLGGTAQALGPEKTGDMTVFLRMSFGSPNSGALGAKSVVLCFLSLSYAFLRVHQHLTKSLFQRHLKLVLTQLGSP